MTVLAIIIVGMLLHINGQATIGEMVTFMNFAGLINSRLEQSVTFINRLMMEAPRLHEFSGMGHGAGHSDEPNAVDPGHLGGLVEFKDVSFSYYGERMAVADTTGPTGTARSCREYGPDGRAPVRPVVPVGHRLCL